MKQKKFTPDVKQPTHSMSSSGTYNILTTTLFVKEATDLKKKYPNIKNDFYELQKKLKADPITGNQSLGKDCYKIRMKISDKKSGKRDGARVIVKVVIIDKTVYVLSVYDKSEKSNITDDEFQKNAQAMS
ncbi:hypothetical protein [Chitinophaga sp.]|uniref:hypothetical protein n=1 Tax=Chitinophaga sp. TaxID=1869181 RepID=UPI002F9250C8